MYNDIYAMMGMCGSAEFVPEKKLIIRKGEQIYYGMPNNPAAEVVRIHYTDKVYELDGYKLEQKDKRKLAISHITDDFVNLKGRKYKGIRNAVNRYRNIVKIEPITANVINDLIVFIDNWQKDYGKNKYGMQLHTGYDKEFFKRCWNSNDFYSSVFYIDNKIVGYSVISRHLDDGALNYLIGKSNNKYSQLAEYIDYATFIRIYIELAEEVNICWGASTGKLLEYKKKFNISVTDVFNLKYRKITHKIKTLEEALGILPVNVWNSTSKEFSLGKSKWNELIDTAGMLAGIDNPRCATRENCMAGWATLSKQITGKEINNGASVLCPFTCELILKLFLPKDAKSVYNPFGGGVQMGFVSGFFGLEYLATEIRQNQCDANNAIVGAMQMDNVQWVCSNSAEYMPVNNYDLIFTCPPYYKVEKYVDYDGIIPQNELNNLPNYTEFRQLLFSGYKKSIEVLNDNRFFVIMVGDSRNKDGAYYCTEAETELFLREQGLQIYNRIVFLENQITRTFMSVNTIKSRKLPKVEQKIIVAYKGNLNNIQNIFEPLNFN